MDILVWIWRGWIQPGIIFEDFVRLQFCSPVSPPRDDSSPAFILVVSFGRCIFNLSSESVGFLRQTSVGGTGNDFCVSQLADRVFI